MLRKLNVWYTLRANQENAVVEVGRKPNHLGDDYAKPNI